MSRESESGDLRDLAANDLHIPGAQSAGRTSVSPAKTRSGSSWTTCRLTGLSTGPRWVWARATVTLSVQDGGATERQHGEVVGEVLLDFLRARYSDETLPTGVRINYFNTFYLVHRRMGYSVADIWPPLRLV